MHDKIEHEIFRSAKHAATRKEAIDQMPKTSPSTSRTGFGTSSSGEKSGRPRAQRLSRFVAAHHRILVRQIRAAQLAVQVSGGIGVAPIRLRAVMVARQKKSPAAVTQQVILNTAIFEQIDSTTKIALLALRASIHVDFHSDGDFNDLWCLPSHVFPRGLGENLQVSISILQRRSLDCQADRRPLVTSAAPLIGRSDGKNAASAYYESRGHYVRTTPHHHTRATT